MDIMFNKDSWELPPVLYKPHGNAIDPDFYALVVAAFFVLIGPFALYQLLEIIYAREYGVFNIKYSFGNAFTSSNTGSAHQVRLAAVLVQSISFAVLAFLNFGWNYQYYILAIATVLTALVILPLHARETTRSSSQLASILIYWTGTFVWISVAAVQDLSLKHHLLSTGSPLGLTLDIILVLNSLFIFVSELAFWSPSVELVDYYNLNEWRLDQSRNIYSTLTFIWAQKLISKVYNTDTVGMEDLSPVPLYITSEYTLSKLQQVWDSALFKAKQQQELAKKSKKNPRSGLWAKIFGKKEVDDSKLNVSLFLSIAVAFSGLIIYTLTLNLIEVTTSFIQPFLLQWFIRYFTATTGLSVEDGTSPLDPPPPKILGFFIAVLIFIMSALRFCLFNQYFTQIFNIVYSCQSSLTVMIYNKALKLTPQARKNKSTGDIVNNVTMDISTIQWFCLSLQDFVSTPIKFFLCLASLYKIIGQATWGGVAAAAILIPISSILSTSFMSLYPILMKHTDSRTSLTTEILNSMKSIKLYSWEKPMLARLSAIRNDKELKTLKKIGIYSAGSQFLWNCIPFFVSCASYATFTYLYDIPLTPDIVFPSLSLFDMLTEPVFMLPNLITNLIEARTSLKRLSDLLLMDELDTDFITKTNTPLKSGEVSISVSDATFVWTNKKKLTDSDSNSDEEQAIESSDKPEIALNNIDFTAKKGQLTCVVGKVGSGKTTLFKALLGEVPLLTEQESKPEIEINGTIAYCSQSPWILNGTVKENILFGCKYDRAFYQKTIDACELSTDFKVLPDGDATVVGEKGISLSGGQKARISLARAVYSKSDIYFFDDVLSAVDAHVGKNIIEKVLGPNGIISTKTKVLATNSVTVLHEADEIFLLKSGLIVEKGNFSDVMARGSDLATLIKDFGRKDDKEQEDEVSEETKSASTTPPVSATSSNKPITNIIADETIVEFTGDEVALQRVISNETIGKASLTSYSHVYVDEDDDGSKKKTGNTTEDSEKGKVKLAVFIEYFRACNYAWVTIFVLFTLCIYVAGVLEKSLLTAWSQINADAGETVDAKFYLTIYLIIGVIGGILNLVSAFILWSLCIIRGARYFHDTMAKSILRSPMRFFETTPVGRILNRFTDDIGVIDMQLPWIFMSFLSLIVNGIVTFAVIVLNLPAMVLIIGVLLILYNQIRKFFIPSSRELKRLSSKTKSPQIAHVQESINGIDTVKAYGQNERFVYKNKQNIDKVVAIGYNSQACNRWLSMRLQCISSIILFASSILALLTIGTAGEINPALLGFIMVYALSITLILNAIVRLWSEVETQSVAVERLVEFCNLPSEASEVVEDYRPLASWPDQGAISFSDYSTRYAENLDPVLKNITLDIKGNEKIGIVGRTGAGKSSLTLALFRIIEATTGHISIDGMNTSKLGLSDLRHQLSIIPQDSHTVEGSVRQNLDPFQEFTDEQLWKVLELAHLKEHVESMKTEPTDKDKEDHEGDDELVTTYALDAKIFEGGSNLSAGQKQLLCLARALLNPSKVLLLDEATAAVDVQTDKIIQETIRSAFKDKTILVIAHRLETIMDSDRVLVLDHGEVKEFNSPEELLKDKEGIFYLLCKEGGYLPKA